jgi:iron-sulfur cluster repair protein YtfE (RIC family)
VSSRDLSVDDALTDDHVRLDGLFRNLRRSVENRDPGSEAVRKEFEGRLLRHMTWEEETLFPALRAADDRYPGKKIESLVIDHARIRERLQDLASDIGATEWTGANRSVEDLWVLLEGHNRDEEKGVYTDADRLISESDRRALLALWRAS